MISITVVSVEDQGCSFYLSTSDAQQAIHEATAEVLGHETRSFPLTVTGMLDAVEWAASWQKG